MNFSFGRLIAVLRKELREYFAQLLTPEVRAELGEPGEGSPLFRDVVRQIGRYGPPKAL